jgi:hypothetical protein
VNLNFCIGSEPVIRFPSAPKYSRRRPPQPPRYRTAGSSPTLATQPFTMRAYCLGERCVSERLPGNKSCGSLGLAHDLAPAPASASAVHNELAQKKETAKSARRARRRDLKMLGYALGTALKTGCQSKDAPDGTARQVPRMRSQARRALTEASRVPPLIPG